MINRSLRIAGIVLAVLLATTATAWAQGAVFVKNDNLGVGNSNPLEDIDVLSTDSDAQILVRETGGPVTQRGLMFLRNNGGVSFVMRNDATSQSWSFGAGSANFIINQQQSGGNEMVLSPEGNLVLEGSLFEGSSRLVKKNITPVDDSSTLEKVLTLPVSEWSYINDSAVHVGPMAEDFFETFGLGRDGKSLAPKDIAGVALAAIKGLNERIEQKDARIGDLETRLRELESLVSSLANR